MDVRTVRSTVRFSSEFQFHGLDHPQPPGEYRVEYDEEQIEGISFLAFRRIATFLHLPAITTGKPPRQMVPVDLHDLEAALAKDGKQ